MPANSLKVRAVGPRFGRKPRYVQQYVGQNRSTYTRRKRWPKIKDVWVYGVQKGGRGNIVTTVDGVSEDGGAGSSSVITKQDVAKIPVKTKNDLVWRMVNSDVVSQGANTIANRFTESLVENLFGSKKRGTKTKNKKKKTGVKKTTKKSRNGPLAG